VEPGGRLGYLLKEVRSARSPLDRLRIVARTWKIVRRLTADERAMLAGELGVEGAEELLERLSGGEGGETVTELHGVLEGVGDTLPQRLPALIAGLRDPRKRKELLRQGLAAAVTRLAGPEPAAGAEADGAAGEAVYGETPADHGAVAAAAGRPGAQPGAPQAAAAGDAEEAEEELGGVKAGAAVGAGAGPAVAEAAARSGQAGGSGAAGGGGATTDRHPAGFDFAEAPADRKDPGTGVGHGQRSGSAGRKTGTAVAAGVGAAGAGQATRMRAGVTGGDVGTTEDGPTGDPQPMVSRAPSPPPPSQLSAGWDRLAAPPTTAGHPTQPLFASAAGAPLPDWPAATAPSWGPPPGSAPPTAIAGGPRLIARFRRLREALDGKGDSADAGGDSGAALGELLDGFPEGWARRRALGEALRSGLPVSLEEAASRVAALPRPTDRLWCWSALIEGRDLDRGEALAVLAAETAPAIRRRLERRLETR
jgi:hypothetical protein